MTVHPLFYGSLTRVADLESRDFEIEPVGRDAWDEGDFVVGEVVPPNSPLSRVELPNGRLIDLVEGDAVVGAFGRRMATLEAVGDWRQIGPDGSMEALTGAGLFGKASFTSYFIGPLMRLSYRGHVIMDGRKSRMSDFVPDVELRPYNVPTLLVIGTSMSSGKTTSAKIIVRRLREHGFRVVGAKLTGAGRYRDILAMYDAGAQSIFDFVDVGLPSSIMDPEEFRPKVRAMLSLIANADPDVAVIEAGASPLEPYNGGVVLEELGGSVRFTLLCAYDPYAVVGVMQGFGFRPDLVSGIATSTSAGVSIVEQLAGVKALDLLDSDSMPELDRMLEKAFA